MSTDSDIIVGIDLGTTFSLVAYADERGAQIIRDENGDGRLPSVLGFLPGASSGRPQLTIGWAARNQAVENPRATVYSVKRLIGKGLRDVEGELAFLAYEVKPGQRDTVTVEIEGRQYTPQEISAAILRALKERAEAHLKRPVRRAVVTVPAYFDDAQRQATRDAAQIAGLEVVRIINEPTAAALAYGLGARGAAAPGGEQRGDGGKTAPSVQAAPVSGNGGGKASAANGPQRDERGHVPLPLPQCHEPEGGAAAGAPKGGGGREQVVAVYDLGGGTFDISILRIEDDVFQVLSTAGDTHLGGDDFDREIVRLVQDEVQRQFGVSIDSPATRQVLRTLSENVKIRLTDAEQAEFELDLGRGRVYRRTITRGEFERMTAGLVQRTLDASVRAVRDAGLTPADIEQVVLAGGSTRMPVVRQRVEELFGRPPYTALNPDEVVALGAAIQASILAGGRRDALLLDVTPLSLGIETMGGAMGKLIMRNTAIPCRATEMFTTFVDGQTAIKINVLQGERELAADCRTLGQFELRGIPPMPAGLPKIEVAFLIDANGILNVSAHEQRSGKQASIQILPSHGLTRDEVDRIAAESVAFARQDIDAHRRIDLVNQVAFDTHKTEQVLARVGERLSAAERQRLEADIAALRRLAETTNDLDGLHRALTEFGRSTVRLAELGMTEALRASD